MAEAEIPKLCFPSYSSTFLSIITAFSCPIDFARFPLSSATIGVEGNALVCDIAERLLS